MTADLDARRAGIVDPRRNFHQSLIIAECRRLTVRVNLPGRAYALNAMIRTRGKLVRYGEVWFDEIPVPPQPDILFYRQRSAPVPGAQCEPYLSLVSDLSVDEELAREKMNRMCRYDIRRAERDGVICMHDAVPSPTAIAEFAAFFDEFAVDKALEPLNRKWLSAAAAVGRLFLTSARLDGDVLVWHAYLATGTTARLLNSCSLRRDADGRQRQLVGRANRLLHWRDMLEFRRLGFRTYDWGGIFPDESNAVRKRINDFKREYGGEERRYFECVAGQTWRGRIYLALVRFVWRRHSERRRTRSAGIA
jgi:hypothetical protein